jgi:hypothetical protein
MFHLDKFLCGEITLVLHCGHAVCGECKMMLAHFLPAEITRLLHHICHTLCESEVFLLNTTGN